MPVRFLDSSGLARAYLRDEPGHEEVAALVRDGENLIASELARVEVARALAGACRVGRVSAADRDRLLARLANDLGPDGPIAIIALDPQPVLGRAQELVIEYPLGTLDAMHLAVAERASAIAGEEGLLFVTADERQRDAARRIGLEVAWR